MNDRYKLTQIAQMLCRIDRKTGAALFFIQSHLLAGGHSYAAEPVVPFPPVEPWQMRLKKEDISEEEVPMA